MDVLLKVINFVNYLFYKFLLAIFFFTIAQIFKKTYNIKTK